MMRVRDDIQKQPGNILRVVVTDTTKEAIMSLYATVSP